MRIVFLCVPMCLCVYVVKTLKNEVFNIPLILGKTPVRLITGIIFNVQELQLKSMKQRYTSYASKKLLTRYILDSIEIRQSNAGIQEMIAWGKSDAFWKELVEELIGHPPRKIVLSDLCKN